MVPGSSDIHNGNPGHTWKTSLYIETVVLGSTVRALSHYLIQSSHSKNKIRRNILQIIPVAIPLTLVTIVKMTLECYFSDKILLTWGPMSC